MITIREKPIYRGKQIPWKIRKPPKWLKKKVFNIIPSRSVLLVLFAEQHIICLDLKKFRLEND